MSPLDDRHFVLFVQEGEAVAPVVNHKTEDAEALRHSELVAVSSVVAKALVRFFL